MTQINIAGAELLARAQAHRDRMVALRRAIHREPELGFEVHRTAALVAETLNGLGIEVMTGVGRTGVVGILGGGPGPVVAIRADMDALPIHETTGLEFSSTVPGRMHACGHDAHTAILLGVAMMLREIPLAGQVRLLFQPSEEQFDADGVSGATAMLEDGALDGVSSVIALHVDGTLDRGQLRSQPGPALASVDNFEAEIIGAGGHAAHPDLALDPIWLASQVLSALYAIPSRRIDPLQPNVITVGMIHAGDAKNVIPRTVRIAGTLRSMDPQVREQLINEVERALGVARALGGDHTVVFERGYPSLHNDPEISALFREVTVDLLGTGGVAPEKRSMGAEDFAYMTQRARGAMLNLGVKRPGGPPRFLHTSDFELDEDALPIGAAALAGAALRLLAG